MRKSGNFIVGVALTLAGILYSCGGEDGTKEQSTTPETKKDVSVNVSDTVWVTQKDFRDIHLEAIDWDTAVTINGVPHTFQFRSVPIDQPFEYVYAKIKNDTLFASRVIGNNCTFDFRLYDAADNKVFEKSYTKEDFATETNMFHIAATSAWGGDFKGYFEKFNAFFLDMWFGYPQTDDAVRHPLFLGRNGEIKMQFDDCMMAGSCDHDATPSPTTDLLSFCSLIVHADGGIHVIEDDEKDVAGSFSISDDYSLVVNTYEGKPPYRNAHIVHVNRGIVYTFGYEGITPELGYSVPHFRLEGGQFVLVDVVKGMLFVFDGKNGFEPVRMKFSELPEAPEEVMIQGMHYRVYSHLVESIPEFYEFEGEIYKR